MGKRVAFIFLALMLSLAANVFAYEFCDDGEIGGTTLRLIAVDDMLKDNSNEWSWQPGDTVEIEARIENLDDDSDSFVLELVAIDSDDDEVDLAEDEDDLLVEFDLAGEARKSVSIVFDVNEDLDDGDYTLYFKLYRDGNEDEACVENGEEIIKVEKIELCEEGSVDRDDLEITLIQDNEADNNDAWTWAPGNDIEVEVTLENKKYDDTDFVVELILLDENNNEVDFAEDSSDIVEVITVDEDDEDNAVFHFKLKNSMEEGTYSLYAKAYDEDDEEICTMQKAEKKSDTVEVEVEKEDRRISITSAEGEGLASLGGEVTYAVNLVNLGREDEDKVSVMIYNLNLGIKEEIEIDDFASGSEETLTFTVGIPSDATAGTYRMLFSAEYDYNDKKEYFEEITEDEDSKTLYLNVVPAEYIEEDTAEEIVEDENFTDSNLTVENDTVVPEYEDEFDYDSMITGEAIAEQKDGGFGWVFFILVAFLIVGAAGFFLMKKPKSPKEPRMMPSAEPNITRRYTARLN